MEENIGCGNFPCLSKYSVWLDASAKFSIREAQVSEGEPPRALTFLYVFSTVFRCEFPCTDLNEMYSIPNQTINTMPSYYLNISILRLLRLLKNRFLFPVLLVSGGYGHHEYFEIYRPNVNILEVNYYIEEELVS